MSRLLEAFACKMSGSLVLSLGSASFTMVALIAVNRYFRVVRPVLYTTIFSKKRSVAMAVVCALIFPIVVETVTFAILEARFDWFRYQPVVCLAFNSQTKVYQYNAIMGAGLTINSLVIVVCYVRIYQATITTTLQPLHPPRGDMGTLPMGWRKRR